MYKGLVLGMVLAAARAAQAQDVAFDIGPTESCLAAAVSPAQAEDCVGVSASACMETPGGSTTVGMGFCLEKEWLWWDGQLNRAYGDLMARHRKDDAEMVAVGAAVPSMADALKAMQRAWIPFRDAACDYERSQWGGGTGGGPASVGCLMVQTGRQALALQRRLLEY
jgi:uncharacterized protein YecT (DUF1311 family)